MPESSDSAIETVFLIELDVIEAASICWIPLDPGVYLHVSS